LSLTVHVQCGYPSFREAGEPWRRSDHDAYKFVQALKGRPIKGTAWIGLARGRKIRLTAQNLEVAFRVFGEWGAEQIRQTGVHCGSLVPVPSSTSTRLGLDAKGRRLAEAIAARAPSFAYVDALFWRRAFPKAAEGGPRGRATLLANLVAAARIPSRPVILVDDVMTTGGHLQACADRLRSRGHRVVLAICAARTVHAHAEAPGGMFAIPPITI
jgi:hypothetical protein